MSDAVRHALLALLDSQDLSEQEAAEAVGVVMDGQADAASVAAQDEIPEVDRGRFESLPCEAQLLLSGWQPDVPEVGRRAARCGDVEQPAPAGHVDAARPRSEGVGQAGVPFPERSMPSLAEFGARVGLAASCGFEPVPFRPPLARAL